MYGTNGLIVDLLEVKPIPPTKNLSYIYYKGGLFFRVDMLFQYTLHFYV